MNNVSDNQSVMANSLLFLSSYRAHKLFAPLLSLQNWLKMASLIQSSAIDCQSLKSSDNCAWQA